MFSYLYSAIYCLLIFTIMVVLGFAAYYTKLLPNIFPPLTSPLF